MEEGAISFHVCFFSFYHSFSLIFCDILADFILPPPLPPQRALALRDDPPLPQKCQRAAAAAARVNTPRVAQHACSGSSSACISGAAGVRAAAVQEAADTSRFSASARGHVTCGGDAIGCKPSSCAFLSPALQFQPPARGRVVFFLAGVSPPPMVPCTTPLRSARLQPASCPPMQPLMAALSRASPAKLVKSCPCFAWARST